MGDEEKKRKSLLSRLKKANDRVKNHPTTPFDLDGAKTFMERIVSLMKDCEDVHYKLVSKCADEHAIEIQETAFEPIEAVFFEAKLGLTKIINQLTPAAAPSGGGSTATAINVRLPSIDLPTFDGKYADWPSFKDLFDATVDNNTHLAPAQKLQYLKAALSGEPANLIKSLTILDQHYKEAMKMLKERYDNTREIKTALITKLLTQKAITNESAIELQKFVDSTSEVLRALQVMGEPVDQWDSLLVVLHVNKLDSATRREWAIRQTATDMPKFAEFTTFINNHIRGLLATGASSLFSRGSRDRPSSIKAHHTSSSHGSCAFCKGDHPNFKCNEFLSKTPADRSNLVKQSQLCFNCLHRDHQIRDCRSKVTCRKCQKKHHSLLHVDRYQVQVTTPSESAPPQPRGNSSSSTQPNPGISNYHVAVEVKTHLKTAIVRVADCRGTLQPVRIFLDDGAEGSLITEKCVQRLGLKREKSRVNIGGVGGTKAGTTTGKVHLNLVHTSNLSAFLSMSAHIMSTVTDHLPRRTLRSKNWNHLQGLVLADPQWFQGSEIDILVGSDYYNFAIEEGFIRGPLYAPSAQKTIFGWVLSGAVAVEPKSNIQFHHSTTDLELIVKKFWEVEEPPKVRILTNHEKLTEKHFIDTYSRDLDGRFVVGVPFNEKKKQIGSSRAMAVRRFNSVERRLHRNPAHYQQYLAFMQEYIALGHMEKIPTGEPLEEIGRTFHLPHHHVINEGSTTTRLRVVFDGSAKTSTGVSLNEAMFVGATLQDDLFDLLLRFRLNPIVIKADITKMFRQFKLRPEDADFHRIVWRESPDQPLQDFRLLTVTYGTACAPNLSTRCILQLASDCKDKYPLASHALENDTYVDDVMTTSSNPNEAIQLYHELTSAVATAGLQLRKWSTNDPNVLAAIPEDERETSLQSFDSEETIKALGVQWCPSTDNFTFKCAKISDDVLTKRVLLADLSKVFDPLGFLSCVTVRAKLQMQELWRLNVEWDEEVPAAVQEAWRQYQDEMKLIPKIQIPRCITYSITCKYQLHGFCDSSTVAYGIVIYLRCEYPDGTITVFLVTSKTNVAPLRQITLPRLELMSASKLSVLIDHVKQVLGLECEVWCWSDSTITLKWIASSPRRWQTFVANRVATIQQHTEVEWWRHVPGTQNPADLASRGVKVDEILNNTMWFQGPSWLSQQQFPVFPMNAIKEDVNLEEKKVHLTCHHLQVDTTIMERFSSLTRLKRVTAHILRFFNNGKKNGIRRHGQLTVVELVEAFNVWIIKVQQQAFYEEIDCLKKMKKIPSKSKLHQLNPIVDRNGILRVGGRLHHADLPEARKHQIILPADSHFTYLLVHHFHDVNFQGGFQLTWSHLQAQFWIIRGRDKVRHFIRSCVTCRKHRGKVAEQLMGNLPSPRITPSRPFLNVGVDYAGPFILKNPIGRAPKTYKAYMCLFVCMATKAIHLEAVSSLTTAAFIDTLRRFVSRRGVPAAIFSDCGTNFVGAERELRQFVRSSHHQQQVTNVLVTQGIQFHFNPPSSPHQGGLWEAGVKSAKCHLRRVMGNNCLTYEVFSTFLCQVEAILNSRPLHPLSPEPGDLGVLTPGHFLIGEPLTSIPDVDLRDVKVNRLSLYQQQQQRLQHFWHRWSNEYLNTLQQRNKWKWERDNVRVGDLVLIKEETSMQQWRMGRIITLHPGADECVRVVTLKTQNGELQRPVVKLIPLL